MKLAREAAIGPYRVIVAGGGDGTVNSIAAAVINSNKILGSGKRPAFIWATIQAPSLVWATSQGIQVGRGWREENVTT